MTDNEVQTHKRRRESEWIAPLRCVRAWIEENTSKNMSPWVQFYSTRLNLCKTWDFRICFITISDFRVEKIIFILFFSALLVLRNLFKLILVFKIHGLWNYWGCRKCPNNRGSTVISFDHWPWNLTENIPPVQLLEPTHSHEQRDEADWVVTCKSWFASVLLTFKESLNVCNVLLAYRLHTL